MENDDRNAFTQINHAFTRNNKWQYIIYRYDINKNQMSIFVLFFLFNIFFFWIFLPYLLYFSANFY